MKFKNYLFVNSKGVATLALTSILTFGGIYSSVLAMQANEPPIIQQVNHQQGNQLANWDGTVDTTWYNENNKNADNFEITTAAQLAGLARLVNYGIVFSGKTITLANNLDMNGHIWTPIGCENRSFKGIFNGNNKTISNLTTDANQDYQGLFSSNAGKIKNIGIINSNIQGRTYVGGIAARNDSIIENSYNTSHIKGKESIGGIVGCNHGGLIRTCYNTGNVICNVGNHNKNGSSNIGGVAGTNIDNGKPSPGIIQNSYNTGNVTGRSCIGGVVGNNLSEIENSYNNGVVNGDTSVGGVVGINTAQGDSYIKSSYNKGDITGNKGVGGIAGTNLALIENSYNIGNLKGNKYVGGIAAENYEEIKNSYYLEVGQPTEFGDAKTADEMQTQEFATTLGAVFMKSPNDNYPVLKEIILNDRGAQKDIIQDYKNATLKFTKDYKQLLQFKNNIKTIIEKLNK